MNIIKIIQKDKLYVGLCLLIAISFLASPSWAKNFSQYDASAQRSANQGLGREKVELLKRMKGEGHEKVADKIVKEFANKKMAANTNGKAEKSKGKNRTTVMGKDWFLEVGDNGNNVKYRNFNYIESNLNKGRPIAQRMTNEELDKRGRDFISQQLRDYIQLGQNESLEPMFTEHMIEAAAEAKENAPVTQRVQAATVVYTRAVDGVRVLGPGSKVAVTFANDGNPVAFSFDWPKYRKIGKSQQVLMASDIKKRAKNLVSADLDSPNVTVKRFECGYFDAGKKSDPNSFVQSACTYQIVEQKVVGQGELIGAYFDAVPAGVEVEADANWPQVLKIKGQPMKKVVVPGDPKKIE